MGPHPLKSMFNPASVAVFGASTSETSVGGRVFANLIAGKFKGPVIPVNPKYDTVLDHRCVASAADLDGPVDLAVIATPAPTVSGILRDCAAANITQVIVLSAGFGEADGKGKALQAELIDTARALGIRLLGPNCVGLVVPTIGLNASFLNVAPPPGRLALVSQSGALCSAISDWAGPNHLGISALVSLGNAAVLNFGDILGYLANDPGTDAILLYVEGIKDASAFLSATRAAARIKPVVVLKAGRHAASARAASTHTGALIGSDEVFDAALERVGAVRAHTFGQLFAAAEILSSGKRAKGNGLCILTNGGGAGVLAADRAEELGLALSAPSEATQTALDALLPAYWSHANPVDILGDASADTYGAALAHCLEDKAFDGALVMLTPQAMTDPQAVAAKVIDTAGTSRKPVMACWMGETSVRTARARLSAAGIPDFTTPERAVEAFSYLARHDLNQKLALETPVEHPGLEPADIEGAAMIIDAALGQGRTMLSDIESKAILSAFHIPTGPTIAADTPEEALVAAETLGFPIAMKIASPQISHKSDVDGVRLNIASAGDVRPMFRDLTARARSLRPDARIDGVTVEPMAKVEDAREVVIGASRDPVFGPTILFGAGGTMVEVLRDSAVSLPPLTEVLANRLISRTRVARLLEPFRGRPAVDRGALIGVLLRVSDMLAELPQIQELDINPVLAGPDGVLCVDARIGIRRPRSDAQPYDHMAIAPYPRHLVERGYLADGTPLTIRPIRPEDATSEQAFIRALSPQARRFRFMSAIRELTPAMLARFTQIDYRREMALVAMLGEPGAQTQHGVARYVINPDGTSSEFAIVVGDRTRNQGLGSRLMAALFSAARLHDLDLIEGEVLVENRPMLQLMQELDFTITPVPDDPGVVHVARGL